MTIIVVDCNDNDAKSKEISGTATTILGRWVVQRKTTGDGGFAVITVLVDITFRSNELQCSYYLKS